MMYIITRKQSTERSRQQFGRFSNMTPFVTVWRGRNPPFDLEVEEETIRHHLFEMFARPGYYQVKNGRQILFKGHISIGDIL